MGHASVSSEKSLSLETKMFFAKLSRNKSQTDQTQTRSLPPRMDPSGPPPNGHRRALLCGVTYKEQKCELKGVAQDLHNMIDLLMTQFKFPPESILILAEDDGYFHPTKKNIEEAFWWLTKGIQPNNSLVFYFSGHGLRQRDFVGDEIDGFDETICPVDFETKGNIKDNYINEVLVRPLIRGVTLHAIVDCCHSGTILDLPHVYNTLDKKWEDNNPPSGAYKGTSGGIAISFSACEDYQLAADTSAFSSEKEMNGAMTVAFKQAIIDANTKHQKITYQDIMHSMNNTLKHAHKSGGFFAGIRRFFHRRILQDPLLSSSAQFDVTKEFNL